MYGSAYLLNHSDAFAAELESLGLDSGIIGAAGIPAPIFQALVPRRAGVIDHRTVAFGTENEPATFARALAGKYLGSDGLIETAAAAILRAEYASDQTYLGALFEPEAANTIRYSNTFNGASWSTGSSLSITANADTAPDGTESAWTLTDPGGSGSGILNVARLFGGDTIADDSDSFVWSVFVKKTSGTPSIFPVVGMTLNGGTTIHSFLSLNTTTGAIAESPAFDWPNQVIDATWSEDYGDYWRVSARTANNGTGNTTVRARVYPAFSSTLGGLADGALTGSQTVWQFDVHKGALAPSSPITTTTASVTRPADTLSWASAPSQFDADAGFCIADVRLNTAPSALPSDTVVGVCGIASTNESLLRLLLNAGGGGTNQVIIENTGGTDASVSAAAATSFRALSRWDGSQIQAGYDSGSGINWGTAQTYIAHPNDGVTNIGLAPEVPVWIKNVAIWNRALTAAEIARLY